jgi:hypothetical protein
MLTLIDVVIFFGAMLFRRESSEAVGIAGEIYRRLADITNGA